MSRRQSDRNGTHQERERANQDQENADTGIVAKVPQAAKKESNRQEHRRQS
jgi:hypothetical protein